MFKKTIITTLLIGSSQLASASEPIEPIMVTIPGASYQMGSLDRKSTQPVHQVDIKEFSIGKYEITVNEFRRFIEATDYPVPQECRHEMDAWFLLWTKGNWETNALNTSEFQPVVCINWKAANAYANWLAKETGRPYRLPSEAEWEYAARAGTKTDYFFGDDPDGTKVCEYANTSDLGGENILQRDSNTSYFNWSGELANCTDHSGYASIVGMYKPNQFGLHDMLSNVLEFLADCFVSNYENTPRDGSANTSGSCEERSTRGGSWHWSHWPLTVRSNQSEDFSGGVDGFRLALDGKSPAMSQATKQHLAQLTFAQEQEQKRRNLQRDIPEPVTNLAIEYSDKSVTLTWDYSEQSHFVSYRVYRNALSGKMFKLLASHITEPSFTDANIDPHKYEYTVVAVKHHMQSQYAKPVKTQARLIEVPGKLEAEWADTYEGSSVSYAEYDDRDGFSLASNSKEKAVLEYQINVLDAGTYQLNYHVSSPDNIQGFDIYTNNQKVGTVNIKQTGDEKQWQTQQGISLKLKQGKNTLTLKSLNNNWKLDWLSLRQS